MLLCKTPLETSVTLFIYSARITTLKNTFVTFRYYDSYFYETTIQHIQKYFSPFEYQMKRNNVKKKPFSIAADQKLYSKDSNDASFHIEIKHSETKFVLKLEFQK